MKILFYSIFMAYICAFSMGLASSNAETYKGYQVKYSTLSVDSCDDSTSLIEITGYEDTDEMTYYAPKSSNLCTKIKKNNEYAIKYYEWPDYAHADGQLVNMILGMRPLFLIKKSEQQGVFKYDHWTEADAQFRIFASDTKTGKKYVFHIESDYEKYQKMLDKLKKGREINIKYQPVFVNSYEEQGEYNRIVSCSPK